MRSQVHQGDGDARRALVGRASEMSVLRAVLDRCETAPATVAVVGDPGIGKTRLLVELAAEAQQGGRAVFVGRAAEFEQEVPFGVLRNALEDHLRSRPDPWWAGVDVADQRLLLSVFPSLAVGGVGPEPRLQAGERYRLHRAVRALLEHLAGPAGLVLILDDLHWCDESSVELLDHLLRHPPQAPVLIATAHRPRQASLRLDDAVTRAVQRHVALVVNVGPLSPVEVDDLLPADLSPPQRHELYEASGGNPFYLEILARSRVTGQPASDPTGTPAVPPPVRAALAGEFAALEPGHQRVLHAAAVAGDGFDIGLLGAIAELSEPDVLAALDELARRDLIRLNGVPGGFLFRHPLLRSAAYHHAGAGWRLGAHARAASGLRRRGAAVELQAGHIEASAAVGDLEAVQLLSTAAAEVMHAAPATATDWLRTALRLLPQEPAHTAQRLQLLSLRAKTLGVIGRLEESRDLLGEILQLLPAGTAQRAKAVSFVTMSEQLLGNHDQARKLLTQELAAMSDQRSAAADVLRVGLALTGVMHPSSSPVAVGQAIDLARGTGDGPLLAAALSAGVVAKQTFDVTHPQSAQWLDEAAELVDAMSDDELSDRLDTALFVGWGELYLQRSADGRRHLERGLRIARRTGQSHITAGLQVFLGVLAGTLGQLPSARVHLDDALDSSALIGGPRSRAWALGHLCWVSVWQGDLDEALAFGEEAAALAAVGDGTGWQHGPPDEMWGFARFAAGEADLGLTMMTNAGDVSVQAPAWQARRFEMLAAAAGAAGDERAAAGWAAEARRLPASEVLQRRTGFIHLAQVHATWRSDPVAAVRHADRAAEYFVRAGDTLSAAQAHLYAGVAHRESGSAVAAEREIIAARRGFAASGAAPHWLTRITGVPLSGPVRLRPDAVDQATPVAPVHHLTPRELSVLHLLAESLTAGSIGRRLEISPGTVQKHLTRLYRKLGTRDRLSTVLLAREIGLLQETPAGRPADERPGDGRPGDGRPEPLSPGQAAGMAR